MKKSLSILLSLIMIAATITALPFTALADETGVCGDGVTYKFYASTGELDIIGNGAMYDFDESDPAYDSLADDVHYIFIREGVTHVGNYAFDFYPNVEYISVEGTVNDIGIAAFAGCSKAEAINLDEGINSIGAGAFDECDALTLVDIPDSVTYIGQAAFKYCYLNSLYLGTGVEEIAYEAFAYCYLSELELPDSLTTIGEYAFKGNNIYEIILPSGLTSIGEGAFLECKYLVNAYYDGNAENFEALLASEYYSTFDNAALYYTEGSCGENVDYIFDLDNSRVEIYGYGDMEDYAPYTTPFGGNPRIKTVKFSDGISHIGSYAFARCAGITSVDTNEVDSVGEGAFIDCTGIKKATLHSRTKDVGAWVFYGCTSLETVDFGAYSDILPYTFWNCTSLDSITLSPAVETVYMNSFNGSNDNFTVTAYCHTNGIESEILEGTNRKWNKLHYETSAEVTPATFTKDGFKEKYCATCGDPVGVETINQIKTCALSTTTYTYNGNAKKPTVTVKDKKGKKISSENYTLSYSSGRKNVGTYTVTVKFKGDYSGTKKLSFKVNPKGTSLSKVTAGKKSFTVSWKKQSTQTTGYQLEYSTDKNFSKNCKKVTVSSNKTTKKTISKLKGGKKYYVRIRTYKTVSKTKYYSNWSSVKSATTKK
ncbi:MAG: fibronectin type III domain-containing protein [Ruminococcaceae bacterium]|nr:fibronectin type III domain-containing protein [Oscillospiraceae bacterium]